MKTKVLSQNAQYQCLVIRLKTTPSKPDPDRVEPLIKLPTLSIKSMLLRALGLFAYYSNWLQKIL